jgi:signal transduction histidine kinase
MGELASTVAHEVRNPLNAIAMSAQRLQREGLAAGPPGAEPGETAALVDVISKEAQRINRIVQQFLEFARPQTLAPRPTELEPYLSALADALRSSIEARGVTLGVDVATAGRARIDPDRLRQALDNLLRNAMEATPAGGAVSLAARTSARGHTIEVRDTGPGIVADTLPKIFDLYFTTKAGGTGIGLAVTQQIVAAHGGTIEVDTVPGRGTTMRVHLPAAFEEAMRG